MIIPGGPSTGNYRVRSLKNKSLDEQSLKDSKGKIPNLGTNTCSFPSKIFVINRGDRPDRWESFQTNNSALFDRFQISRWDASVTDHFTPSVVDAIFKSFTSCLEENLFEEDSIIIMEDDAYLAPGGIEKLQMAWKDLPEDWDVLIGNHYFFGSMEILSDHLAKPDGRASTVNFAVYKKTVVQKIRDFLYLRENEGMRDFDHFLTSELCGINNFTVWPMISREIASFSDHKQVMLDSASKIREHSFKYVFIDQDSYYSSLKDW